MTQLVCIREQKFEVPISRGLGFADSVGISMEVLPNEPREESIARYEQYFQAMMKDEEFATFVVGLKDKILGCSCRYAGKNQKMCHGDIIIAWLKEHH